MIELRPGLPPLPPRIASLPIDERGYPCPWFIARVDGKPDHRLIDGSKLPTAIRWGLCWMCGQRLGRYKTFCIGPMCCITRTISEPPSHLDCARFAAQACPFLTRPHATRRGANMPEDVREPAGVGLKRNPGVVCLWTTTSFQPRRVNGGCEYGNRGILFELGVPTSTEWYAEGRPATRDEIMESLRSGIPALHEIAEQQGVAALTDLARRVRSLILKIDQHFGTAGEVA